MSGRKSCRVTQKAKPYLIQGPGFPDNPFDTRRKIWNFERRIIDLKKEELRKSLDQTETETNPRKENFFISI